MRIILTLLAVSALAVTTAKAGPAADELANTAGATGPVVQPPPSPKAAPGTDSPREGKINIYPSQADIYRWYQDGSMGTLPEAPPRQPAAPPPPGDSTQRAYKIKVASSGGRVNVEIARSTAPPGESPMVSFNGGRSGKMFSGTVLLGDSVQMSGFVNIESGIQISHSQHFTVFKIPFNDGAKFMLVTGNGISFMNSENELSLVNTAEAGFRVDVPIGKKTTLLRIGLTGGPGVAYQAYRREGGHETSATGTVSGNISILNW